MRIMLLNPPFLKRFSRAQRSPAVTKSGTVYFPMWLAYCAGVLEEEGFDVSFIDAPVRDLEWEEVFGRAEKIRPGLIVLDTSTPSIENDIRGADELKARIPGAFVVLVGTHVSALPEETLQNCRAVDAVARREYEGTIRSLALLLREKAPDRPEEGELSVIEGISFRTDGRIVSNPDRPFIEDLDKLPWVSKVYKKHLRITDYFNPNALYPMVTLITGRGCPFGCKFCVYPQTFTGRKYRLRSIEDVLDEIEYVVREFPQARSIFFEDDTLTVDKERCIRFSDAVIERRIRIPWSANSRIDLDFETMARMKAAGCRMLCVGFEAGDQRVLNSMHKGTKVPNMLIFMENARKAGILVHGCFMVGFPGETREHAEETIKLAIRLKPDTAQFYPVMVYPGTESYREYQNKGWIKARSYADWLTPEGLHNCVVENEHMTAAELVRLCDRARRTFYLRAGYIKYKLMQAISGPAEFVRTARAARTFIKHLLTGSRV